MVWQKNYGDPGASPGTLAPLPDAAPHVVVTAIHYTAEEYTETQVTDLQAYLQQVPRDGVVWFNVDGLGDIHILEILGAHFGLHPLSLEDVLHIPQRAKLEDYDGLPTAFPKKWTCDLPLNRAWSGRCGFEADLNRFALIPQVHRTQPCYYLHQQAVIRSR